VMVAPHASRQNWNLLNGARGACLATRCARSAAPQGTFETDAIKELNQPRAGEATVPASAERPEERRAELRADTADLPKLPLSNLEQPASARAAEAAAGQGPFSGSAERVPAASSRWSSSFFGSVVMND
jgi:hypothetical protein